MAFFTPRLPESTRIVQEILAQAEPGQEEKTAQLLKVRRLGFLIKQGERLKEEEFDALFQGALRRNDPLYMQEVCDICEELDYLNRGLYWTLVAFLTNDVFDALMSPLPENLDAKTLEFLAPENNRLFEHLTDGSNSELNEYRRLTELIIYLIRIGAEPDGEVGATTPTRYYQSYIGPHPQGSIEVDSFFRN